MVADDKPSTFASIVLGRCPHFPFVLRNPSHYISAFFGLCPAEAFGEGGILPFIKGALRFLSEEGFQNPPSHQNEPPPLQRRNWGV